MAEALPKAGVILGDPDKFIEMSQWMFGTPESLHGNYEMRELETGEPSPFDYEAVIDTAVAGRRRRLTVKQEGPVPVQPKPEPNGPLSPVGGGWTLHHAVRAFSSTQTRPAQPRTAAAQRAVATPPPLAGATLALQRLAGNDAVAGAVQAKLRVGGVGDPQEREANAVAVAFMLGKEPPCTCGGTCPRCRDERAALRRAPATGGHTAPSGTAAVSGQDRGQPLDAGLRRRMERFLRADLATVRVHTGHEAVTSAGDLGARAYTVGDDIVFGAGQSPQDGRLLAHELAHVLQQRAGDTAVRRQTGAQPAAAPAPAVSRVLLSCADDAIVFETATGSRSYRLSQCDLTEGEYTATVSVTGNKVQFHLGRDVPEGVRFRFSFDIAPGQPNPAKLFAGQRTVAVVATNQPLSLVARQPEEVREAPERTPEFEQFKRLVRNAGKARMTANRQALEQWRQFLERRLTSGQLENQVVAADARELLRTAEHKGTLAELDQYARTNRPHKREYLRGTVTQDQCPSCHAIMRADAADEATPESERHGKDWIAPAARLAAIADEESRNPSPRPSFLTKEQDEGAMPKEARVDSTMYPSAASLSASVVRIRPFLHPLGPTGYQVLPQSVLESRSSASELLAEIVRHIERRQSDYMAFSRHIDEPDFDYLELRPIVRDLLPLASDYVRVRVQMDMDAAEEWASVKAIFVGIATIGALLLTVFPPTSALGAAALGALEVGLGAYGVYEGVTGFQEGHELSLARGAGDVLDPEQVEAANTMMAMGALSVALGGLGIAGGTLRVVRVVHAPPVAGTPATAAPRPAIARVQSIEGEVGGQRVTVSGLDTPNPQVRLTGANGNVIKEGPLETIATSRATTGDPLLDADIEKAFSTPEPPPVAKPLSPAPTAAKPVVPETLGTPVVREAPPAVPEAPSAPTATAAPRATPRTLAAGQRVAETEAASAAAGRQAAAARLKVAKAESDLQAARELAADPGAGAEGAKLVRRAQADLKAAQAELRPLARSEATAGAEAAAAARGRAEVIRLEADIADLDTQLSAELNPPGGFSKAQVLEGRRPGVVPVREARLQPSGARYHQLAAQRAALMRQLASESEGLTRTLAEEVAAATPGAVAKPDALRNAASLDPPLRPVNGTPIDVTTGRPMTSTDWATDHIVSRTEIVSDARFARLTPLQRDAMLRAVPENYLPLTAEANSSKGALSVDAWIAARAESGRALPDEVARALRVANGRARAAIDAKFAEFLPK